MPIRMELVSREAEAQNCCDPWQYQFARPKRLKGGMRSRTHIDYTTQEGRKKRTPPYLVDEEGVALVLCKVPAAEGAALDPHTRGPVNGQQSNLVKVPHNLRSEQRHRAREVSVGQLSATYARPTVWPRIDVHY